MTSFLKKIFQKTEEGNAFDFSGVITDMHSHLIPGIDDGSKSIDESITLIRDLHALGFRKFITTPHIMNDFFRNTPEIIREGLGKLRMALADTPDLKDVCIEAAAEYYLDDGFLKILSEGKILTLGDKFLLVETSYINCPDNLKQLIFDIQTSGLRVILAHPERYPFWYDKFEEYMRLKDLGVYFQININSLTGYYSPAAKKTAEKLIDEGMVEFIGTDTHGSRHIEVLRKCVKEKYFRKIIESGRLLNTSLMS